MTFSIGVPTYNQAPYIRETLLTLLNQEEPADRVLVSNNHSTDETAEILEEFVGKIDVTTPPRHLTAAENWNFVASQLQEDWFSLLSSDDLAYPNYVRVLKRGIARSPTSVLVRAGWDTINEDGSLIGHHHLLSVRAITRPPRTLLENRVGPKTSFAAFAIARKSWQRAGGFPKELPHIADWGMWINLASSGDFICEDEIISAYRVNSLTESRRKRNLDLLSEHVMVFRDLMPKAAKACGIKDISWIRNASRKRFIQILANLSQEISAPGRAEYALALQEWAEYSGETALLQRFSVGETIRNSSITPYDYLRDFIRPIIEMIKS